MKKLMIWGIMLGVAGSVFAEMPAWMAAAIRPGLTRTIIDEPAQDNRYLLESIRAHNLAKLAYAEGDYDLSMQFSADALRSARLSDEFITQKLKIAAANEKIGEAKNRLGWAEDSKIRVKYSGEYNSAKAFYNKALLSRTAGEWDNALNNAIYAVEALANVTAPAGAERSASIESAVLPAQYTVRQWDAFGDCLWNIAGRPWVYNNSWQWPLLYRANKSKLVDPNNPNVIEPGTILDIPSIRGEVRQGMWDSGKKYTPLK
ncbi:MAG: LysM peptidoglycan-binding domain-containing protein [Spirochaetaceae bacterium]|jgi:hypothetical protein|nr:LysM peptidoglycan-binding domain-containing protein [Spirochaetaceae bacterium]